MSAFDPLPTFEKPTLMRLVASALIGKSSRRGARGWNAGYWERRMKAVWFFAAFSICGAPASAADVTSRISPKQPISERGGAGESLNFDIILRNQNSFAIVLTELEVTYQDQDGAALLTRRVDGNGGVPSITTLGDLKIAGKAQRLFFNPFPVLPPEVRPASVTVRASFERSEGEEAIPDVVLQADITRSKGKSSLLLPLTGRVLVWDGHDLLSHHRRWDYTHTFLAGLGFASNAMRYSYDFVPVDAAGEMKTSCASSDHLGQLAA